MARSPGCHYWIKPSECGSAGIRDTECRTGRYVEAAGAAVTPITIYRWDLPEDLAPLEEAVKRVCDRWCHAAIFLSSVQLTHLLRISERANMRDATLSALQQDIVIVSIGPVMTDALVREGLRPDFAPKHPKLGVCIRQFADQAQELVQAKRGKRSF